MIIFGCGPVDRSLGARDCGRCMDWIFYFIALDLSLKPGKELPKEANGQAWQVHGGGFYNMVKYLVAPSKMPDELTWFKREAYSTWISGMA